MSGRLGEGEAKKEDVKAGAKANAPIENIMSVKDELDAQKKHKIIIPSTETEMDDVFVGINGYTYQIKRDVAVEVPESVIKVLQDAKVTKYKQVRREDGEGYELVASEAQRFAFQTVI
jgi:hypothetical protein